MVLNNRSPLNIQRNCNLTEEMFQAYFNCRENKRNTINALKFEKHFEQNVFKLCEEIKLGIYVPGQSK